MPPDSPVDRRSDLPRHRPVEIAFVNNMPDQALASTCEQFTRLLTADTDQVPVRIRKYVFHNTPRSDKARLYLAQSHEPIDMLYARGADVLIVTGTEPRATSLRDEPFWPEFARLVDWARYNTISTLWSCLAAHGAVLHLDGIERRPEQRKISGVYSFATTVDAGPPIEPGSVRVPHSRYNGLSRSDLETQGYRISSWSEAQGVDMFWRREPSLFVFTQGHMEYDAETLSREYRRDVLRYFSKESAVYPDLPEGYFSDETTVRLDALKDAAKAGRADVDVGQLMDILSAEVYAADWSSHARHFYQGWLAQVAAVKADGLAHVGYRVG